MDIWEYGSVALSISALLWVGLVSGEYPEARGIWAFVSVADASVTYYLLILIVMSDYEYKYDNR